MSGGYFYNGPSRVRASASEVREFIEKLPSSDNPEFSDETLEKLKECQKMLEVANAMFQRVDYLLSGDDSEDSFSRRWEEEVTKLKNQRAFSIGDCVILNHLDRPYSSLVAVVVGYKSDYYEVTYLNADLNYTDTEKSPMLSSLKNATRVADFGVEMLTDGEYYWCKQVRESEAKYADGQPRQWQEYGLPVTRKLRGKLFNLIWPNSKNPLDY